MLWHYEAPVWFAVVFALVVGLQYLMGPYIIQWIFKIQWAPPETVSTGFAQWMQEVCGRFNIPEPGFGVIPDGRPNAFTFGHYPKDARVVVTRGLVDMLSPEELQAVVAHELGHIRNWDFVVMTVASAIPLVLYMLYMFTRDRGGRNSGYAWAVGVVSYIAYYLSNYIVLLLSRIREYYADYFSARATQDPNALSSALVTIAYGLAKTMPQVEPVWEKGQKRQQKPMDWVGAAAPLGIASGKLAAAFAAVSTDISGNFSLENMKRAMRWEVMNPWARLFELASTHPLTARRIQALQEICRFAHKEPAFPLVVEKGRPYGGKFWVDLVMIALPYIGLGAGLLLVSQRMSSIPGLSDRRLFGFMPLLLGVGWVIRLFFEYPGDFNESDIVSLIGATEVSHIRSIPTEVRGKIIGRGIPGLFYSKDLVLQDEQEFILLNYRQPLGIWVFLFGWLKAERFIGREASVRGWYRRTMTPFIEIKEISFDDGERIKCYHYPAKFVLAALLAVGGTLLTVMPV